MFMHSPNYRSGILDGLARCLVDEDSSVRKASMDILHNFLFINYNSSLSCNRNA